MNLFKRCSCGDDVRCDHPYWYRFWLHRREAHRGSTHTANRELANRIAIKRQNETLEDREKLRKLKPTKLSEHVKAYADWAEKTNRSSIRKDRRVLNHFVETIGDSTPRRSVRVSYRTLEDVASERRHAVKRQSRVERDPRLLLPRRRLGAADRLTDENGEALPSRQYPYTHPVAGGDQARTRNVPRRSRSSPGRHWRAFRACQRC